MRSGAADRGCRNLPGPSALCIRAINAALSVMCQNGFANCAVQPTFGRQDDGQPSKDHMNVVVKNYPQLRQLCWNRPDDAVVDGEVALALYERNWRFVQQDEITPDEQALLDMLVAKYGNGHLLVA